MRFISLAVLLLGLAGCLPDKNEPTVPIGSPEYTLQQGEACRARGGVFGAGPSKNVKICFERTRDANAPCRSDSDCEGVCLARSRTCAPYDPLGGCNEVILDGGQTAEICLN